MKYSQVEAMLTGPLQRDVWGVLKEYIITKASFIAFELEKDQGNVTRVLNVFIELGFVVKLKIKRKEILGTYRIKKGVIDDSE